MIYRITMADLTKTTIHGGPRITMQVTIEADNVPEAVKKAQEFTQLPTAYRIEEAK